MWQLLKGSEGEGRVCRSSFDFESWRIGSWVVGPLAPTGNRQFPSCWDGPISFWDEDEKAA